jgi:hypothetical protein
MAPGIRNRNVFQFSGLDKFTKFKEEGNKTEENAAT